MDRIVFASYLFAPLGRAAGVNRACLARYLAEDGWGIDVVTGERYKSLYFVFQKDPSLLETLPPAVRIHRFDSLSGWLAYDLAALCPRSIRRRTPLRSRWIDDAASSFRPEPNSVVLGILSKVDNAILAHRLAEQHDLPLALHFVDDTHGVDQRIIKRAALLTGVTPHICDRLRADYRHPRVEVVRHGYVHEIEVAPEREPTLPLRIAYSGSSTRRMPSNVLPQAYALLRRQSPELAGRIRLDFYGHQGGYYYHLFLRRHACDQVRFNGYLGIGDLLRTLPEHDLGFACAAHDLSFSSKTYNYLNAGLPLLVASDHPGLRDFVNEHKIGLAARLDAAALAEHLRRLAAEPELLQEWRKNVLAIRRSFSAKEQAARLSTMLRSLAG